MTTYADIARDIALAGVSRWGLYAVSSGSWVFLTSARHAEELAKPWREDWETPSGEPWEPQDLFLVEPQSFRQVPAASDPTHLYRVADALQDVAMDEVMFPFPELVTGGTLMLAANGTELSWGLPGSRQTWPVGRLRDVPGLRTSGR